MATFFERSAPEAQGIRSGAMAAFIAAAERDVRDLHSLIVLRRGRVVAEGYWEPYDEASPHMLFSLSKSFTSTAIGMLVADGKLSVEDPVLGFFPSEAPAEPSENLRMMRVKHLLTMTTGHAVDPSQVGRRQPGSWVGLFLAHPVLHEPGTQFVYNSAATYLLSAIAQKITGQRLVEFLGPRLFEPLGIANPTWETSPQGIDVGGWGLNVTTRDIARFGQLYLNRGVWNGQRLLSESWIVEATGPRVPNAPAANPDWEQGYGYQFWRCRHGAYRGDGAFGQFCVVMPEQQAVVAITSGVGNMQQVLDLVWEHLLPAFGREALPENRTEASALAEKLASLRLAPVVGERTSPLAASVTGGTFAVDDNEDGVQSVRFDFGADECSIAINNQHGEQRIALGYGAWKSGAAALDPSGVRRLASSGAWVASDTYEAKLVACETPFAQTMRCRFDGERLTLERTMNVGFGAPEKPTLVGRRVP